MENKNKAAKSCGALNNEQISVLEKFYQHLFLFLLEIEAINEEEDFFYFVFTNQVEVRRFLKKCKII